MIYSERAVELKDRGILQVIESLKENVGIIEFEEDPKPMLILLGSISPIALYVVILGVKSYSETSTALSGIPVEELVTFTVFFSAIL